MKWISLQQQEPPVEVIVLTANKVGSTWDYCVADWDGYGFSDAETMRSIEPTPTHWAYLTPPKEAA